MTTSKHDRIPDIDAEAVDDLRCRIGEISMAMRPMDILFACASVSGFMLTFVCPCCRPSLLEQFIEAVKAEATEEIAETEPL
jgi:hypothetical protein